jgi:hypothetical protein
MVPPEGLEPPTRGLGKPIGRVVLCHIVSVGSSARLSSMPGYAEGCGGLMGWMSHRMSQAGTETRTSDSSSGSSGTPEQVLLGG